MKNKLPEKYKDSFFIKVKRFFNNIFCRKSSDKKIDQELKVEVKIKENEFNKMKEISNKSKLKEEILDIIEKKPELIETLSVERLRELDRMYDEIILENDRKINKLKREIS